MVDEATPSEQPKKPEKDDKLDSKEEIVAKTELVKAEKELIEVRHSLFDRIIMRGAIPLALIVAGPITTYYFSQRADDGIQEVRKIGDSIEKLDTLIDTIKTASARNDEARAAELIALRRVVSSLQWNLVVSQAREVAGTMGRSLLRTAMSRDGATFDNTRQEVEDALYTHLAPRVDADARLLKDAIRGAVDEIRPSTNGTPEPRFPTRGQ